MAHQAPTKNWVFNQVGIRVTDIRRSQTFYEEVFGMKPLKTLVWDDLTFVLLGYSRGPEGSLYDREGVLELVYSEVSGPAPEMPWSDEKDQMLTLKQSTRGNQSPIR